MSKMNIAILLLALLLHSSTVLCQQSVHIMTLHRDDSTSMASFQTIGVVVDQQKLNEVSNSVLMAENWLRTYVLSYYPLRNINSVIVANDLLCNGGNVKNREEIVRLVVDSMKNLHHSLIRWGLEREIRVSVSFSSDCLRELHVKPVFSLLEKMNSTFTMNLTQFSDDAVELLMSEMKSMNDFGVFRSETVNVIVPTIKQAKSTSRKLSFIDNLWYTATPPPPMTHFSPAPGSMMAPVSAPSHPYGISLPPCNPYPHHHHAAPPSVSIRGGSIAPAPVIGIGTGTGAGSIAPAPITTGAGSMAAPPLKFEEKLWCVAKPSVPSEKLQVALDYACGPGGADCGPIKPNGSCFSPDSVVAHASYAFNSYWQKNKKNGGMCGFEGTAMLISTDPSFLHCHFVLG